MTIEHEIAGNLTDIRERIALASGQAGRDPAAITLVAVSKLQPTERIEAALTAGQRCFGENYVQEAKGRWPELRKRFEGIDLHLIGPLQTNKAADAVALFDVIQTLDRDKLARALVKERDKQGRLPRLYVQVNLAEEPQKAGILPDDLERFLGSCRRELELPIDGLMAIPPDGEDIAPYTVLLGNLAARYGVAELSIGMSADFEIAVRFGATQVRVGTAIFGARPAKH